jgi:hypothetical protein
MSNNIFKNFPKNRVCVINIFPFIENGIKEALIFSKQHNVKLISKDGKSILLAFCIKQIKDNFNKIHSPYQKVACISYKKTTDKIENFIESYIVKKLKENSIPYCGKYDLLSPDVDSAARNCLDNTNKLYKDFSDLFKASNLRKVY